MCRISLASGFQFWGLERACCQSREVGPVGGGLGHGMWGPPELRCPAFTRIPSISPAADTIRAW